MVKLFSTLLIMITFLIIPATAYCQNSSLQAAKQKWLATLNKVVEKQGEINEHERIADPNWLYGDPYSSIGGRRWVQKYNTLKAELSALNKMRAQDFQALKAILAPYDELINNARLLYKAFQVHQKNGTGDPVNICRALRAIEADLPKILNFTGLDSIQNYEKSMKTIIEIGEKLRAGLSSGQTPDRIFKDLGGLITDDPALKGIIGDYSSFLKLYGNLSTEYLATLPEKERARELIGLSGKVATALSHLSKVYKAATLLESLVRESKDPFGSEKLSPLANFLDLTNEFIPDTLAPVKGYLAFNIAVLDTFGQNIQIINFANARKNLFALNELVAAPNFVESIGGIFAGAPFGKLEAISSCNDFNGFWIGYGYNCGGDTSDQRVEIRQSGNKVTATKITGNKCVPAGLSTWEGVFNSHPFRGQFRIGQEGKYTWVEATVNIISNDELVINPKNFPTLKFKRVRK
jgi:hypothetical protein